MKTAKEIEKLAFDTILSEQGKLGFVVGYNCCQKDISKEFYDKQYTEDDIRKAILEAQRSWVVFPNHNSFEDAQVEFMYNAEEIIDSLNKK
jgi:hypothetical protein